jgi:hypothetical protein
MNLMVGDLFREPAAVKAYLVKEHGLSERVLDDVMAASFNMSKVSKSVTF